MGPPTKKSKKKQSHDVVIRKGRDKNVAEISKLEKLLGMQPSKKKKKLPASFRTDGLDCIQPYYCGTVKPHLAAILQTFLQYSGHIYSRSSSITNKSNFKTLCNPSFELLNVLEGSAQCVHIIDHIHIKTCN